MVTWFICLCICSFFYICLYICLSICILHGLDDRLAIRLSVYLHICLSVYMLIYVSKNIYPFPSTLQCQSIFWEIFINQFINLTCQSIHIYQVCQSLCPSIFTTLYTYTGCPTSLFTTLYTYTGCPTSIFTSLQLYIHIEGVPHLYSAIFA